MRLRLLIVLALLFAAGPALAGERPKLVVVITVDQMRGDYPARFRDRLAPDGGLRWLIEKGLWYQDARYEHLATFTAPGHATLFTGAGPAGHGIVGNSWYDDASGAKVYCVQDRRHRMLGLLSGTRSGTSPRQLQATTIGDELVTASGGRSRVFSVSVKDRGAILPGGQYGKAFWYSRATGGFHSSTYYFDALPAWVEAWNKDKGARAYAGKTWTLSRPEDQYRFPDDRAEERGYAGMGRTFPHAMPEGDQLKTLYSRVQVSPFGDELTIDFVKALIAAEDLGGGAATDMLAVSLSATDYIGHSFGPDSREMEDQILRLDAVLGALIRCVEDRVGIGRALYVLSSDHGVAPIPEVTRRRAPGPHAPGPDGDFPTVPDYENPEPGPCLAGGRHKTPALIAALEGALARRFKIKEPLILGMVSCGLYLNEARVREQGLKLDEVEAALAEAAAALPGMRAAFARHDLKAGRAPDTALGRRAKASFHERRSGHVLLVADSHWLLYPDWDGMAASHGSAYVYDAHVPLFIARANGRGRPITRRVAPRDLAPTLARMLDLPMPSASSGAVLKEAVGAEGSE